jgi:hypothetical protein
MKPNQPYICLFGNSVHSTSRVECTLFFYAPVSVFLNIRYGGPARTVLLHHDRSGPGK